MGGGDYDLPSTLYEQAYCLPEMTYVFTIEDAAEDGLCCGYGEGSYEVRLDGVVVAQGGEFDESESTAFSGAAPGEPVKSPTAPIDCAPNARRAKNAKGGCSKARKSGKTGKTGKTVKPEKPNKPKKPKEKGRLIG